MNVKQKVCIWIGIVAFVMMGIFPPWVYRVDIIRGQVEASAGYSFLASPPEPKEPWNWSSRRTTVRIDFTRLLIQWTMVMVLLGGLVLTLRERKII